MTNPPRTAHLLAEELLDYFEGALPDDRQQHIEEHIADCEACAALARQVDAVNDAWDWTAEEHAHWLRREQLAQALDSAEVQSQALRGRLQHWRQRWAGLAEAAVRIGVSASAATVRVVAGGLDGLAHSHSAWRFTAAADTVPARGIPEGESASALLATAPVASGPSARLAVRGGQLTEVEARINGLSSGARPPLVLLLAVVDGQVARVLVAEAETRPGATYCVARFRDLAPGEYIVAFEPLPIAATDATAR